MLSVDDAPRFGFRFRGSRRAAGRELARLGRSVLVLEATDRVGGRGFVGHIQAGAPGEPPVPIDYGGAWIHGVATNPLTAPVDLLGFERVKSELDAPFHAGRRWATDEDLELFDEAYEAYVRGRSGSSSPARPSPARSTTAPSPAPSRPASQPPGRSTPSSWRRRSRGSRSAGRADRSPPAPVLG